MNKAFSGRVRLPGYAADPLNATMEISSLRTNDSGTYHCQVVMGNNYERDAVPLVVYGKLSRERRSRDDTTKVFVFFDGIFFLSANLMC